MASEGLSRKEGERHIIIIVHNQNSLYCPYLKGPVHTNPDTFKSAYFVTRNRVDEALNYSGERLKKMWFSVDGRSIKKIYAVSKISGFVCT